VREDAEFYIRPIRPDDAERERQFIETLSPESRHQRFMHTVHNPSSCFIQQMVNVEYRRTMALVAVLAESDSAQIMGTAQAAATDEHRSNCDFAVAVTDI
jgi:hypothetical protein